MGIEYTTGAESTTARACGRYFTTVNRSVRLSVPISNREK